MTEMYRDGFRKMLCSLHKRSPKSKGNIIKITTSHEMIVLHIFLLFPRDFMCSKNYECEHFHKSSHPCVHYLQSLSVSPSSSTCCRMVSRRLWMPPVTKCPAITSDNSHKASTQARPYSIRTLIAVAVRIKE